MCTLTHMESTWYTPIPRIVYRCYGLKMDLKLEKNIVSKFGCKSRYLNLVLEKY